MQQLDEFSCRTKSRGFPMVRFAAAVLAFTVLPGVALAQEPVASAPASHEVVRGNTLWDLAEHFYQDPYQWPRIWEANRDRVEDPHWIYPGQLLRIPGLDGMVREVVVMPAEGPPTPPPTSPQDPVGPAATPTATPTTRRADPNRTVFWRAPADPAANDVRSRRFFELSDDAFWSAPWLVPEGEVPRHTGELGGFDGAEEIRSPRHSARPYDRLRITFDGPTPPVGTELQAFRRSRTVETVGEVIRPTGTLEIVEIDRGGAVAVVVNEYARMRQGDFVRPLPRYPLTESDHPMTVTGGIEATVLAYGEDHELQSMGDAAFVDAGRDLGLSVGDEFVVIYSDSPLWQGEVEGRLQIVTVQDDHSTARIVGLENPVFVPGIRVRLSRKMP